MTTQEAKKRLEALYWTGLLAQDSAAEEAKRAKLRAEIIELGDAKAAAVLLLRYERRRAFKDIAKQINYSVTQTRRLHDEALAKYAEKMTRAGL